MQLLPALTDQPVLDLGCGEGLAARTLAARGAQVTGVDLSEQMIGHACRQETTGPLGIDFRVLAGNTIHPDHLDAELGLSVAGSLGAA